MSNLLFLSTLTFVFITKELDEEEGRDEDEDKVEVEDEDEDEDEEDDEVFSPLLPTFLFLAAPFTACSLAAWLLWRPPCVHS